MMDLLGMAEILGKLKKEKHKLLWQRSRAMAIKHNFSAILTEPKSIFPALYLQVGNSYHKKGLD
ncbi:MAG: hypothetical protein CM1200mP30_29640 [Pseudomonadota bacterium]|nr:MAG: hypothetical protein CM1200mP30_29640 [Pseudomonadota bacterium]